MTSSAGDAQLSVLDASADHPGHLVNGTFSLANALQVAAGSSPFAPLRADNGPLQPEVVDDAGQQRRDRRSAFKQTIDAGEGLRTGTYGKTLTFTLSTTAP